MARKELTWRGMTAEEVVKLDLKQFTELVPSRSRRALKRGFTDAQKKLLKRLDGGESDIKTHCRDLVILPVMVGKTLKVYNGKEFVPVLITVEMLGARLGEYSITTKSVSHSAPGIGATRSSEAISVR